MSQDTQKAPYKSLRKIAASRGVSIKELVLPAIKETGSMRAAAEKLGISHSSIQWWMARNGYRVKSVIVPADSEVEAVQS